MSAKKKARPSLGVPELSPDERTWIATGTPQASGPKTQAPSPTPERRPGLTRRADGKWYGRVSVYVEETQYEKLRAHAFKTKQEQGEIVAPAVLSAIDALPDPSGGTS